MTFKLSKFGFGSGAKAESKLKVRSESKYYGSTTLVDASSEKIKYNFLVFCYVLYSTYDLNPGFEICKFGFAKLLED